jgi:transcriptional regulator with XRE-family HTH domain
VDMADFLKITQQAYGAYERNVRLPDIVTIGKIADYFDVSVDFLLETNYSKSQKNGTSNIFKDKFSYRWSIANKLTLLQDDDFKSVARIINLMIKKVNSEEEKMEKSSEENAIPQEKGEM